MIHHSLARYLWRALHEHSSGNDSGYLKTDPRALLRTLGMSTCVSEEALQAASGAFG